MRSERVAMCLMCALCTACSTGGSAVQTADVAVEEAPAEPAAGARQSPEAYLASKGLSSDLIVRVELDGISVRGERVVALDEGLVRVEDKEDGEGSLLIVPLYEALDAMCLEWVRSASPVVSMFVDPEVQYRQLSEVMYTIGQARDCNGGGGNPGGSSLRMRLVVSTEDGWGDGSPPKTPAPTVEP